MQKSPKPTLLLSGSVNPILMGKIFLKNRDFWGTSMETRSTEVPPTAHPEGGYLTQNGYGCAPYNAASANKCEKNTLMGANISKSDPYHWVQNLQKKVPLKGYF